jgi:ABC-2 type transport system permease protein
VLRAFPTLLRVGFADAVAYRAEMLVWMLTATMPLVGLALWSAVAEAAPVGRFAQRDFVGYFLAVMVVRQLTSSWVVWEMNMDVRTGAMARRLLKPVPPLAAYAAENLAAIPLRALFALPFAVLGLVLAAPAGIGDPARLAIFAVSLVGAWLVTFATMAAVGSLSFFLGSSSALFDVWFAGFVLFSGYIVPTELLPGWTRTAATLLPYRYLLAFPVETLLGLLGREQALADLGRQWAWVVVSWTLALALFRAGLRRWAAFGG